MTEGNISNNKRRSYCCIYYPDRLKYYQRETKLFEWVRAEDEKKRRHFAMVWLKWLGCSGFVYDGFYFSRSPMLTISFLATIYTEKYWLIATNFLANENAPLAVQTFS